jgi:hypothetical protein
MKLAFSNESGLEENHKYRICYRARSKNMKNQADQQMQEMNSIN